MKFKKLAVGLSIITLINTGTPTIKVFANELNNNIKVDKVDAKARINKFMGLESKNLQQYNEQYMIDKNNIRSITTNGKNSSGGPIQSAVDGDIETFWHTGKLNSDTFTNEVVVEFKENVEIDRIVYGNRRGIERGFAEAFTIYGADETNSEFVKITEGEHKNTQDFLDISFNKVNVKKIKFVFNKCTSNWASIAEMWFYKEDEVLNKMNRLFTDNNLSAVSEEFNSVEKINNLEAEVKEHPLYDAYKEKLEEAKAVVEGGDVVATEAQVRLFEAFNNKEYNDVFKIDNSKMESIKNNAGNNVGKYITNAIDGDINTDWSSNKVNSDTFTNEVELIFKERVELNRVVYGARQSDIKGFAEIFELYGSKTATGDNYELITTGKHNPVKGLVEAKFDSTQFKRMKFKFKKAKDNWSTLSEIAFYKQDKVSEDVNNLFVDGTQTSVKEEYTLEKINQLESDLNTHPLKSDLIKYVQRAKDILNNPDKYQTGNINVERRGNSGLESGKRRVWSFQDWQPTGLAVKSGDVIDVYVDVAEGDPVPTLTFKQMESAHNGLRDIQLQPGKNTITIPEVEVDTLPENTALAGVLYIKNPYDSSNQSKNPKVRIEGAFEYPCFVLGVDNDEAVMQELQDYVSKLESDSSLPDVFEVFSERNLVNVRATQALNWYTSNNKLPSHTAKSNDDIVKEAMKFYGLDEEEGINSDFNFRYVHMVKNLSSGVHMNAGNGITGVRVTSGNGLLDGSTGWGNMHEMGHNFDTRNRIISEVTNNMLPLHFSRLRGDETRLQTMYPGRIYNKVIKEDYTNNSVFPEGDSVNFSHVTMFWQLELFKEGSTAELSQMFRVSDFRSTGVDSVHNEWAKVASDVFKMDMVEHFERHGANITDETKAYTSKYPKLNKKTWYMNDNIYLNNAGAFSDDLDYKITSVDKVSNGNKINIQINESDKNNVMGYEIYRNDKLVGFTHDDSFIDTDITDGESYIYKVVAFDGNLNPTKSAEYNTISPKIQIQQPKTYLGLNKEFNPLEYVKASSHDGRNLNANVDIKHNVDPTKKGTYNVEYTITDENISVSTSMEVEVVSDYKYLSDIEWSNVSTQYGTPRKNSNIKGRVNGDIKDFTKGIGIHANGEAVYNLDGETYDNFEALLGVDGTIAAQTKSSVTFKVVGDGKVLATTNVLKHSDNMVHINVPVKGVKELKIEIHDGGNGNSSDSSIIVNPILTVNNTKPELSIPEDFTTVKFKSDFNLLDNVKAVDIEDGDITSKIEVKSNGFDINKPGKYTVEYIVSDNDNNKITKTRDIMVYSNVSYASDIDWVSAISGWKDVNKDSAVSSTNKIKLNIDGTITEFDKGIGAATNAEIVYDIEDKGYGHFTTYLGTDKNYGDNRTSIDFIILADGKEVYKSKTINRDSKAEFVSLDLTGVKELKLIADNNDGSGLGDFASWADTKFYTTNAKPQLSIPQDFTTVKFKSDFNLLDNVKAVDIEDGDITSKIEVKKNGFDINKPGKYTVEYTVSDNDNNKITKTRDIMVYSNTSYASDIDWVSATSGWKDVNKDSAVSSTNKIKLNIDGTITEFDKGIGAATNAEIVYDIENKGYGHFTTYLGTDKNYEDNRTSIDFIILADGKEVYKSKTINKNSKAEFVSLDLTGVKELKLIADNNDGSGLGDFASWADTKFYTTNGRPRLEIEESTVININEPVDNIVGNIVATDDEDGDITSKVVVTGHENINFNKPGKYKITYSVTDSDNNTISKERTVSIIDMRDADYLTDYDWKSAVQNYSQTKKDISASGGKLRLTNENNEEVVYEKGIGAHAKATIIYDLSDKNYEYFTSFVGVDRAVYNRPGSVIFEVYVDGSKKFDSGLMNSTDAQKNVKVNVNGAKELKLVVTDGGNGNSSDHATWGDTKLHFINSERADTTKLLETIEKAEKIEKTIYTQESIQVLENEINKAKEILTLDYINQTTCDDSIANLENAINSLEVLNMVIEIEDEVLKSDIKRTLGITSQDISLVEMQKLTALSCDSGSVRSLKGLEYAINLESLNIDYNEVSDISPIKDLKKLKNFSGQENFILSNGENVVFENGKFIIDNLVIDSNGEKIVPTEVVLSPNSNPTKLILDEVLVDGKIVIDSSLIGSKGSVEVLYESKSHNYQLYALTLLSSN